MRDHRHGGRSSSSESNRSRGTIIRAVAVASVRHRCSLLARKDKARHTDGGKDEAGGGGHVIFVESKSIRRPPTLPKTYDLGHKV